ncbi:MAG: PQQ-binding-like beta-propeller repeat protein [Anaerolineales bacterium]|nr:PQQ-binding-like beta-propeller repeat protein [Anaerolineales bacterium]
MTKKTFLLLITFFLLATALSACGGSSAFGNTSWPGITTSDDTIYLAGGSQVFAVKASSGVEIWHYPEKASANISFYAAPVLTADGQLLVAGYDSKLYSLDPASGAVKWVFEQAKKRYIASPLVNDAGIFAPSADGTLYALDMEGNPLWSFKTEQPIWATPVSDPECECIYMPSMDHHIYALDVASGDQLWKSEDLGGAMVSSPAYRGGVLYIGTFGNEILALDAKNGDITWRFSTEGWVWAGPALTDDLLIVGDLEGWLYAIQIDTGTQSWRIQPDGDIASTTLILDNRIYATTETDTIYAVDLEGNIIWRQIVDGKLFGPAITAGDQIMVGPTDGDFTLAALTQDGSLLWTFPPEKE